MRRLIAWLLATCAPVLAQSAGSGGMPAYAQNMQCPERPVADNSNACASTSYADRASSGAVTGAVTGLNGDVAATGPGNAAATIQPGAVTSAKMATGAASTNVGALGGQLSGTLPNPNIASGTVTNTNLANMVAGTVKCNPAGGSTGAPRDCSQPAINVLDYNASGSTQSTTGTISASSSTLTLAAAIDFANGQGIRVNHAGAAFSTNPPTGASATPQGTPGGTTYTYTISSVDANGGIGASIANFTTNTGNATLNFTNFNKLQWTAPVSGPAPAGYAIYGRVGGSLTLQGFTTSLTWNDYGQTPLIGVDWAPNTPPGAALADWLLTTISSGGGTTTLTLANSATTTATSQVAGHDDSAAIQAAINAAPAVGTEITFPCLDYALAKQVNVGNGGVGVLSTRQGITLRGLCNPVSSTFPQPQRPRLLWTGGPGSGMVAIQGPLEGWGVQNLFLYGSFIANAGLFVQSAKYGDSKNLVFNYFTGAALDSTTVPSFSGLNTDSLQNRYYNMVFTLPPFDFAEAILLSQESGGTSDTDANTFIGTYIALNVNVFNYGIYLLSGDGHHFVDTLISGGTKGNKITFDYTGTPTHTGGTVFYGVDTGCLGLSCTEWANAGTPASNPNYVYGLGIGNSGVVPNIANLTVYGPNGMVISPGGSGVNSVITAANGHIDVAGPAPTITAGCNGAGSQVVTGTDQGAVIEGQTAAATTCTITFAHAFSAGPSCAVQGLSSPITGVPVINTTGITVTFASSTNYFWSYACRGT